jgi:CelD/BcsL family acetyltransferase involved in cellulose biosynthesis
MNVELHTELDLETEAVDAWREFAVERDNAHLTPEWIRAWLSEYGDQAAPVIAVARGEGGEVRGVLPLARLGAAGGAVLRFAGYNLGDIFHPACAEADDDEVAAECLAAIATHDGPRWGAVLLDHVPAEATWPAVAADAAGLVAGRPYREEVLPFIELGEASWDDYLATRSRNMRSQVRRKTKALERDFEARYRLADESTLERDLDSLVSLHERRWEGRGESGALGERPVRFHGGFAQAALGRGWLRLWILELGGKPAAAWYGWRLRDRYCYYQAGIDPDYEKQSLGVVLLGHTVRAAIDEGAPVYDMLRGDEDYKLRFVTGERRIRTIGLARRSSPARLATAAESAMWHAGQRLGPEWRERAKSIYRRLDRFMPGGRRR